MQSLQRFSNWLKEGVNFPWGEVAEKGIEAVEATSDLSESWLEAAPKIAKLENLDRLDSFFKLFESPIASLAVSGLPLASVGIGLLRLYWDVTKTEPTFESSVALAMQMAYLESLSEVLERAGAQTVATLEQVQLARVLERQLKKSEEISLTKTRAKKTLTQLRKSELAEAFDEALGELLVAAGLADWQVRVLVDQVAWGTPKYFHGVVAELKDEVAPLADFLRSDGLRVQERFDSIEDYLKEKIDPLPHEQVFDEDNPLVTFNDLYVPLSVKPLSVSGEETDEAAIGIHDWAAQLLEQSNRRAQESRKVGFIEGEAGRGKSVFCRMFAAMVRVELYPAFIPILIRLRDIRTLENNLTQTLETHLQDLDFVMSDRGWLTDENTRFLLIFDGFDELLLQGRESGGLKELIQQLGDFQKGSHHQCLVTGRPLALQGVDRMLSQTKNLVRVRLEPMAGEHRKAWIENWAKLFGAEETKAFCSFLMTCPKDIDEGLAREPLLLYLLGRLHREQHFRAEVFAAAEGVQAKIRVYDESVRWVLERQRQELNKRISGLETEDLRQVLQEAALCVVQSGNETAKLTMLKGRFVDDANPVAELLKQAQAETERTEDKALNNLLTAFYLKPGEGDRTGSVEFAHKSFGEFLFAERLRVAFEDWVELDRRQRPRLSDSEVARQIYDLLGYGPLTVEIADYWKELILSNAEFDDIVRLFQRLHQFYENWCEGSYIDKVPGENLPQSKMMQLKDAEIATGLRQVDIYTGLNVMILLFELHRYGRQDVQFWNEHIKFHPCGDLNSDNAHWSKVLQVISYSQVVSMDIFKHTVGRHLDRADLSGADLTGTDFIGINLFGTNLGGVSLADANLAAANLCEVNLIDANLLGINLRDASVRDSVLSRTNLRDANLRDASLSGNSFIRANLCDANLIGANICNGNFRGSNLRDANLSDANLRNASFVGANLEHSNLMDADLRSANLRSANLRDADLRGASACGADFHFANLQDARFNKKTDWKGVSGLETAKNVPEALTQQLGLDH